MAGALLVALPQAAQHTILGVLPPHTKRVLRLTCRSLRTAVDGQVKRLVMDNPGVDPSVFSNLLELIVLCWKPAVDELDLQLLLAHLPYMDKLESVQLRAAEHNEAGSSLLLVSRRAAAAPWQTIRRLGRLLRHGGVRRQAAGPQQHAQDDQSSTDDEEDMAGQPPSLHINALKRMLSLLACARARCVSLRCMAAHPDSYLCAAQLMRQARADQSKALLWDGMLPVPPSPQQPGPGGQQAGGVEVIVQVPLVPAGAFKCLRIDQEGQLPGTWFDHSNSPQLRGYATAIGSSAQTSPSTSAQASPSAGTSSTDTSHLDEASSAFLTLSPSATHTLCTTSPASGTSLLEPPALATRHQRLLCVRQQLRQLEVCTMASVMSASDAPASTSAPPAAGCCAYDSSSTAPCLTPLHSPPDRSASTPDKANAHTGRQPGTSFPPSPASGCGLAMTGAHGSRDLDGCFRHEFQTCPSCRHMLQPATLTSASGGTPFAATHTSSTSSQLGAACSTCPTDIWAGVRWAVQPQVLMLQPVKLRHASDLRRLVTSMDACLTEVRLDIPQSVALQLLPDQDKSPVPGSTAACDVRLSVLGNCRSLQRLSLNFLGESGPGISVLHLGSATAPTCQWDTLLSRLADRLTGLVIRGDVSITPAGYNSLGSHLTHLNSLTLWLKGYVTDDDLQPLANCTNLANLQIARLHLKEPYLHPVLPQVLALSVYMTQGCDSLHDVFPCLKSAVLRDWPAITDPVIFQPLANTCPSSPASPPYQPSTAAADHSHPATASTVPPAGPLTHLLLLQHTHARWQLPWGDLTSRIVAHTDAVSQMWSLKVLVFKGFTCLDPVRSLCLAIRQLPHLMHLGLGVAPGTKMKAAPSVCNTFRGLNQITSLHVDCQGCSWDVVADLLLLPPATLRRATDVPALKSLSLSGVSVPLRYDTCVAVLERLPHLTHLELSGCKMAAGQPLHLLPSLAARPHLEVVVRGASGTEVEPGGVAGEAAAGQTVWAGRRAGLVARLGCGLAGTRA